MNPPPGLATACPAREGEKGGRWGRSTESHGRAVEPYRETSGVTNCSEIINKMKTEKNTSRERRRASNRSSHKATSRCNVTFNKINRTQTTNIAGSNAGFAAVTLKVMAPSQQVAASEGKSARPYAKLIR